MSRTAMPVIALALLVACEDAPDTVLHEDRRDPTCTDCKPDIEPQPGCLGDPAACIPSFEYPGGISPEPDLVIDEEVLIQSIRLDRANFAADDCAVEEGCVAGMGERRLLRFTLSTPNVGTADLVVGDPSKSKSAVWSACHDHFHMAEFARYRLVGKDGSVAAAGHKQAFCLMDSAPWGPSGREEKRYDCSFQGISVGWTDVYGSGIDCQWVDITDVPEGEYFLEIEINGARRYPESRYDNNSVRVPVFVPGDSSACVPREEVCGDGRDQDCDGIADDDCPPLTENDTCESAWPLDGSGIWTGAILPTTAVDGTGCGGEGGTLHFSLRVLTEEIVLLSTHGSEIDTVLRVEEGACDAKASIACSEESCGSAHGRFVGRLAAGDYDVVVQAREAGASGRVRLTVQRSGCNKAHPLVAPGSFEGDTRDDGRNTMTACGLGDGPDEMWFFASCPGTHPVELHTCGATSFDSVLELREGSCRGRSIACNDDADSVCGAPGGSRILRDLEGESLWFLVVDGYNSGDKGIYRLDASF